MQEPFDKCVAGFACYAVFEPITGAICSSTKPNFGFLVVGVQIRPSCLCFNDSMDGGNDWTNRRDGNYYI